MKTEHTSEKWNRVTGFKTANDLCVHEKGKLICTLPDNSEASLKDSKLIAAAPEMLSALQNIIGEMLYSKRNHESVINAKAAIKQATE